MKFCNCTDLGFACDKSCVEQLSVRTRKPRQTEFLQECVRQWGKPLWNTTERWMFHVPTFGCAILDRTLVQVSFVDQAAPILTLI